MDNVKQSTVVKSTLPKVLFVIDTLEVGGAEQSLLENLKRFDKVLPLVCHLYKGETLKSKFLDNGIKVYSINSLSKYGFVSNFKALNEIVHREKPDAIVAYLTRSELVSRMVALKHGIPVFGTFVSDLYSNSYNKSLSFKAKVSVRLFKYLNILTAPICKGFIANSEAVKLANAHQLYVNPFKIEVINRGRDENKFRRIPGTVNESAEVNFINIGRLVPVKGQLELIKAFSKLAVQFSEVHLSIAGEGPCRKQLEEEIENQGMSKRVKLLGSVSNLHELLPASDCFVFPSHSEGFSGSVVEAMMCGVPVLASDIAVNKEVVTHGYNGYLFESGSEQAIYESMKWFLSNRAEALLCATTAIGFARENFGLNHIAGKLQDYLIEKTSTQ